jgi:hypothetical protein
MGAVVIQTAKVRKMVEQPYLRVEAPERSNGWGSRTEYTHEEQKAALAEIQREIKRHVDDLGHVSMVAPEVLVCKWCENPADDCEQEGPEAGVPLCCDEAVEEYDLKYRPREKAEDNE